MDLEENQTILGSLDLSPDFTQGCLGFEKQIHPWLLQGETGDGTGSAKVGMLAEVRVFEDPLQSSPGRLCGCYMGGRRNR